jgi:hypothetical protein
MWSVAATFIFNVYFFITLNIYWNELAYIFSFPVTHWPKLVTVAERSKAWTVIARSEAGIMGSNPTQGMDVWCVYVFILC